jgi:hypothetical protein
MKLDKLSNKVFKLFCFICLMVSLMLLPPSAIQAAKSNEILAQNENVRIYFSPANMALNPAATLSLMLDTQSDQIAFVRIDLAFDRTKIQLSGEIQPTDLIGTVIQKTTMASANSSGQITIMLGLFPGDPAPSGLFEVAQIPIRAATTTSQNTTISFVGQNMEIVDQNAIALPFICEPIEIVTNAVPVDVYIGDIKRASYYVPTHGSMRKSFSNVSNGPVKILSTNSISMLAAERVIYQFNGVNTSFTEMMGAPQGQLDTIYWLPWYNNVDLDTQLRIANVSGSQATITVTIGGVSQPSFNLAAGASTRLSYAGVNNGPVRIVSTQNIVAAARVIYKVNSVNTSFSEMMALPQKQLDKVYYLPWYNNVDLDTQLRIANVTNQTTTVTVTIGGVSQPSFNLTAGASTRVSYAGMNNGPVKIASDQDIVAAERVIYKVNGVNTSFSEMMALSEPQLGTTYLLPWYNNVDLDTQLRIANVTNQPATVTVTIGGLARAPIQLAAGESTRLGYSGLNAGPVDILSTQNIVVAERVIYKINNLPTSFSEMMGLPEQHMDTIYWLPWYNNVDLDTQLRFGVP